MSTYILDHPDQLENDRLEMQPPRRGTSAGELRRDTPPRPAAWVVLESAEHDWFPPAPGRTPTDATLHVKIRGAFHETVPQAQAGISHGRHYQSLLHDAGFQDVHVAVRFEIPAGDSGLIRRPRALVCARGRRAPHVSA